MTLEQALSYAIENEGVGIISEARLKNYLTDLKAFDSPAIKRIVVTMVDEGYMKKIQSSLESGDYELHFNDTSNRLVTIEGFQKDLVEYVMNCLLYAVNKTNSIPVLPQTITEGPKIAPKRKVSAAKKNDLKITQANDHYLVEFEKEQYELDPTQYKAIMRKKDMPADRLKVWLKSYVEENN